MGKECRIAYTTVGRSVANRSREVCVHLYCICSTTPVVFSMPEREEDIGKLE